MLIRKIFKFESAHRVTDAYTERCRGIHGHSYKVEVFIEGDKLDQAEMVMDFKLVKETLGVFIDKFDHALLINSTDKFLVSQAVNLNPRYIIVPYNPTAEQMAKHFLQQGLKMDLPLAKVIVHETETGYAEVSKTDNLDIRLGDVFFSQVLC